MASALEQLQAKHEKQGLFTSNEISISYPMGFPGLDQQLGARYIRKAPDGTIFEDVHVGIPAGTFTIFSGQTSSGKTTAAIQAAANIVEPFGEDAYVIHRDGEKSTSYARVQSVTGWDEDKIKQCYSIERENCTWEHILKEITSIAEDKEVKGEAARYDTGQKDIWGNEYRHYIPTVIIIDSLMKFGSEKEVLDMMGGLTSGGRSAIYNGMFFKTALEPMYKYNINVFMIAHLNDAMPQMNGLPKPKQMTFMLNGKYMSGGDKVRLLTSSMINFRPLTSKDDIKTEEVNGWNGVPTEAYVIKSRTSKGGFSTIMEFVQESGFDARITLMNIAKKMELISGRNPNCFFASNPDVKFDTRCILKEFADKPEVLRALFAECKEPLNKLIPVVDLTNDNDIIRGAKGKMEAKQLMREMLF